MRDFQFPGRSPVRAMEAMVATSHPLSTLAAIEMLRSGGNAMDAAVCACAVQAVVEPQSTGIGGDCFVLFSCGGGGTVRAFNGSGRSPAAATLDWYRSRNFLEVPTSGPHSVTIPGAIDAWCRLLEDHGEKGIAEVLAPAIAYAENGYVVHDRVAFDWRESVATLCDEHAARIFLKSGAAYAQGDVHVQPELAATLRTIAAKGRYGFYDGEVAADIVERLRALGGLHTMDDFAATSGDYVEPVSTNYRGYDIYQMPPNNQAMTALLMLNILSNFDVGALRADSAERLHLEIEAGRLAYRDRDLYLGDQDKIHVPVKQLLSRRYSDALAGEIDSMRAMTHLPNMNLPSSDTVYISVVDRDRNAVSFINSTFSSFGSGIVGPRSGVLLQNRGTSFRLIGGHPNAIAPRKRPLHTIMPGMAAKDGRVIMPFGVMGGGYQPFGHVHLLSNLIDFSMDLQLAIDAARVYYQNGRVEAERGVDASIMADLQERGHVVVTAPKPLGGGQAVLIDWEKGTLTGASDPRKDGCAIGY
ncbi:gamma-glutamyltransferase [Rhizobium sp. R72]|uniref:gamma-glutamyltransferase n=1 Tax=unclassified Rhizobium TaxID=2613769 RepID=UPI000B5376EF|nr:MULTISPECIES: gamma-glutamyltransferase [unclassified Rhizobium]OWW05062.1 gamma-glutamyltransferase [Rhizobium sp. R72]OWW06119.1 gamma-glutamyltransferase [Rhizobium sp. R711]